MTGLTDPLTREQSRALFGNLDMFNVMVEIARCEVPFSATDISRMARARTGIALASAGQMMKKLEAAGLIEYLGRPIAGNPTKLYQVVDGPFWDAMKQFDVN